MNFWQDENLFGQETQSWSGRLAEMRGQQQDEMLGSAHVQLKTVNWQADRAILAKSNSDESRERAWGHTFCSCFACPWALKLKAPAKQAGSDWWQQWLMATVTSPPISPTSGQSASRVPTSGQCPEWQQSVMRQPLTLAADTLLPAANSRSLIPDSPWLSPELHYFSKEGHLHLHHLSRKYPTFWLAWVELSEEEWSWAAYT